MGIIIIIIALTVAVVVAAFKYGVAIGEEIGFNKAVDTYEEYLKEEHYGI